MLRKELEKRRVPKYGAIVLVEQADGDTDGVQGLSERLSVPRIRHPSQLVMQSMAPSW